MTFTKPSTLNDAFLRRSTLYNSSVFIETATDGLNGAFPMKPRLARTMAVVSSSARDTLTDVERVYILITAILMSAMFGVSWLSELDGRGGGRFRVSAQVVGRWGLELSAASLTGVACARSLVVPV